MFIIEKEYTKNDIYNLLNVPLESQKGSWDTGYRSYNGDIYIFANIGTAGRTGVNHGNYWDKDKLVWFGKATSHKEQKLIKMMISSEVNVHMFFRNNSSNAFTYKGLGHALLFEGEKPIKIVWTFLDLTKKPSEQKLPIFGLDEIYQVYKEGKKSKSEVYLYQRSLSARKKCIEIYGCICSVCGFDFEKTYGLIGQGFIHIHHINQLSEIKNEYIIDPEKDLVPICPNCHSMLHKRNPSYTIEELKSLINKS